MSASDPNAIPAASWTREEHTVRAERDLERADAGPVRLGGSVGGRGVRMMVVRHGTTVMLDSLGS